jgi:hypothetical protein
MWSSTLVARATITAISDTMIYCHDWRHLALCRFIAVPVTQGLGSASPKSKQSSWPLWYSCSASRQSTVPKESLQTTTLPAYAWSTLPPPAPSHMCTQSASTLQSTVFTLAPHIVLIPSTPLLLVICVLSIHRRR